VSVAFSHPLTREPVRKSAPRPDTHGAAEFDFPPVPLDEHRPYDRIRELYLYEEPALLAAIGRGDRGEAIRIINYILVHIYSAGQERSDLLKGLLLELVVMMSRAAIEAGSLPTEVLGLNYRSLTKLAGIDDDEQLAHWLRDMFERAFGAMQRHVDVAPSRLVTEALSFMRGNLHRAVTRDETARSIGISPRHLSRLLRERTGRSYRQLLHEARITLASELLATSDEPLVVVAGFCGFCDQAYFTNVFQQTKHMTPRQFREAHRVARAPEGLSDGVL
jgi:AraC-like DNA-binding protein